MCIIIMQFQQRVVSCPHNAGLMLLVRNPLGGIDC
jgi:hypothetical protein